MSLFLHDDRCDGRLRLQQVTVTERNPLDMGNAGHCDDCDGSDNELQRFSKGRCGTLLNREIFLDSEVVEVVRETRQPSHVSLWLRPDTAPKGRQED